ncbi:arylsulfatase [Bacteroides sp.]|uniref:arylsulfatase n=1 Tax=Bacteroides sp. TaxID=29523 RepID=UPI003A93BBBE
MENKMKMLAALTCLTGLTSCGGKQEVKESRPNIIYFLVDDMGFGDLSMCGQKSFKTPNIDRLAADGMFFTNHYTGTTVSGPSRACLMTGKHTGHTSVRGNQPGPQILRDDEATLALVLKEAGYATAVIGKWGIGHPVPLDDPQKKGFELSYGYLNMWHAHNCYPEFLYRNGVKEELPGNKLRLDGDGNNPWADMPEGTGVARQDARALYAPDLFEREALRFMEANRQKPFFLYYSLNLPHANNEAAPLGCETPGFDADIAAKDWPEVEKGFAQMMRIIDRQVGEIVAKLEELGLAENTVFMFASDNGPHQEGGHKMEFFDSNSLLRGMKRDMYEGGVRTPFIVKWPAQVQAGSRSNLLSAFWDVLPTFCDLAGVDTPEGVDGISLMPTLTGNGTHQQLHKYLYFEFYEEGGKQAVVSDNWKYVKLNVRQGKGTKPVRAELYNLADDRGEHVNVADRHPEIVKMMEGYVTEGHSPFPVVSLLEMDGKSTDMSHD